MNDDDLPTDWQAQDYYASFLVWCEEMRCREEKNRHNESRELRGKGGPRARA
jgi:hypothetical protein